MKSIIIFFICNYGSNLCIDNDDGSSFYQLHHNFEVYGGHKSDFGGGNKFTYLSINAYTQVYTQAVCANYFNTWVPHYVDGYYQNKCIQSQTQHYQNIAGGCTSKGIDPTVMPVSHGNEVYTNGPLSVQCGEEVYSEEAWQGLGMDVGTKRFPIPSDEEVIMWARDLLEM